MLIAIFAVLPFLLFAQTDTVGRFSISLIGAAAIPVGSYSSMDADAAAIFLDPGDPSDFVGFSKETSGFAETGYSINLDIRYRLLNKWYVNARVGYFENGINASPMEDWLEEQIFESNGGRQQNVTFDHDDVVVSYFAPGLGYMYQKGKLAVDIGVFAGWGRCNYPGFLVSIEHLPDEFHYFGQTGETPNLSSFVFGSFVSVNYWISNRIKLGIDFSYLQAGFDYTMTNVSYPGGGSPGRPFDDTVLIKLLNPGFKVGYAF